MRRQIARCFLLVCLRSGFCLVSLIPISLNLAFRVLAAQTFKQLVPSAFCQQSRLAEIPGQWSSRSFPRRLVRRAL